MNIDVFSVEAKVAGCVCHARHYKVLALRKEMD